MHLSSLWIRHVELLDGQTNKINPQLSHIYSSSKPGRALKLSHFYAFLGFGITWKIGQGCLKILSETVDIVFTDWILKLLSHSLNH